MAASIIEHFSTLKDPRIECHKRHSLIDIIVLTLAAVASGADHWKAIEDFGQLRKRRHDYDEHSSFMYTFVSAGVFFSQFS